MSDNSVPTITAEQIEGLLKQKLRGRVWNLQLVVEDGHVVLRGRACSYYAKQLAQHAAMEAIRLPIRANEIEVR
jgi:hypothetical protein